MNAHASRVQLSPKTDIKHLMRRTGRLAHSRGEVFVINPHALHCTIANNDVLLSQVGTDYGLLQ